MNITWIIVYNPLNQDKYIFFLLLHSCTFEIVIIIHFVVCFSMPEPLQCDNLFVVYGTQHTVLTYGSLYKFVKHRRNCCVLQWSMHRFMFQVFVTTL